MYTNGANDDGFLIHCHSRAQMLADAELVDVSEVARLAGFIVPVALTRAAWAECVEWVDEAAQAKSPGQSEAGRLWDVLWMARVAAATGRSTRRRFLLKREPQDHERSRSRRVVLVMQTHTGDH